MVHDAERGAFDDSHLAELIMAGREIFRLEQAGIARQRKGKTAVFIDEVEVYTGFQNQLRVAVADSNEPGDMRFYNVSGITESEGTDEAEIRIKWLKIGVFHKWFALWGRGIKVLERIAPEEWRGWLKGMSVLKRMSIRGRVNAELKDLRIADDS